MKSEQNKNWVGKLLLRHEAIMKTERKIKHCGLVAVCPCLVELRGSTFRLNLCFSLVSNRKILKLKLTLVFDALLLLDVTNTNLFLSGGSVAWGHPQHGQLVHVRDLHRDEKPPLPGPSVWNSGHTEGTEVRQMLHCREIHLKWCRHSHHAFTCFISLLKWQNPVSEAAEQRTGQVEEPEFLHGVRSWPEKKWLEWMD